MLPSNNGEHVIFESIFVHLLNTFSRKKIPSSVSNYLPSCLSKFDSLSFTFIYSCAATHVKLNNVNQKRRQLKFSIKGLLIISSHCGNNLISLMMFKNFKLVQKNLNQRIKLNYNIYIYYGVQLKVIMTGHFCKRPCCLTRQKNKD